MASFLSFPILTIAAVIQATFIPQIRLLGGGPDLVYLLVLAWAINGDLEVSVLWAFVGGVAVDLLSMQPTGTSVFGMLLMIFAISGLGDQVFRIGFLTLIGVVIAGTVVQQVSILLIITLIGYPVDWLYGLSSGLAPTVVYNALLIGPIYWIIRGIQRRVERRGGFSIG